MQVAFIQLPLHMRACMTIMASMTWKQDQARKHIMTAKYAGAHVSHYKRAESVKVGDYIQVLSDNGTALMYHVTSRK